MKLTESDYYESLYIRPEVDDGLTIIITYVDDMLIVRKDDFEIARVSNGIEKHVEIHVEPTVTKFLGIRFID